MIIIFYIFLLGNNSGLMTRVTYFKNLSDLILIFLEFYFRIFLILLFDDDVLNMGHEIIHRSHTLNLMKC